MTKAEREALLARISATDWEASNDGVCRLVAREIDRERRRAKAEAKKNETKERAE